MRLEWLGGVAAVAFLAKMGTAAAAIVLASSPLCNLGTGTANSRQGIATPISNPCILGSQPEISSISWAGGSSTGTMPGLLSGVYAGNSANSFTSPFLIPNPPAAGANPTTATATNAPTANYLAAQPGGSVTVTYSTPQSSLAILWGTVDGSDNMNLLSGGSVASTITGAMVCTALGINCNGSVNAEVDITGIPAFTTFTVSDAAGQLSAFEFVPGTQAIPGVPEPTSLALLGTALAGFGIWRRRKTA